MIPDTSSHTAQSETQIAYFEFVSRIHARLPEISQQVFSHREHVQSNAQAEFLFGRLLILANDQSLKTELQGDHDLSLKLDYMTTLVDTLDRLILPDATVNRSVYNSSSPMRM